MQAFAAISLVAILGVDIPGVALRLADPAVPPERLSCLARHYNLTPMLEHGDWAVVLPGGVRVPWRDGKAKTFEQRLDSPDIEDIFLIPYRAGPIRAVEIENEEGGTEEQIQEKVTQLINVVGAEDVVDALPASLSTGRKRAVAIAQENRYGAARPIRDRQVQVVVPIEVCDRDSPGFHSRGVVDARLEGSVSIGDVDRDRL